MLLQKGDKLLIAHRRLFQGDAERYFIGSVEAYDQGVVRIIGHTWVHDVAHGKLIRKEDKRCKIISLVSGSLLTYQLPAHVAVDLLRIEQHKQHLVLTGGDNFIMDISDRVAIA